VTKLLQNMYNPFLSCQRADCIEALSLRRSWNLAFS
jgi:hypothetical protein